jgi:hypothetical protein
MQRRKLISQESSVQPMSVVEMGDGGKSRSTGNPSSLSSTNNNNITNTNNTHNSIHSPNSSSISNNNNNLIHNNVPVANVVRHKCGTSPFDSMWLNWDCCGLFCAFFTYGLHLYGVYTVTQVLLPPWMSYQDEEFHVRRVSSFAGS